MKVALVIFPIHASHGCILQTYALYTVLERLGHKVTIINIDRAQSFKSCLISTSKRVVKKFIGRINGPVFYFGQYPKKIMSEIQPFIDKYLSLSIITIKRNMEFPSIVKLKFDAYVIGSDQTWRPKYVDNIYDYFLDFVPEDDKSLKIAYAPSFGTDEWEYSKEQQITCADLIHRFNAVSTREQSGIKFCHDKFKCNAVSVLDPTLLLHLNDYCKLQPKRISDSCENLLSYYLLDADIQKMKIINYIASILSLTPIAINSPTDDLNEPISKRIAPSIEKWLGGFMDASFIVADSFHAMVFAIIYKVPFVTIVNKNRGAARFVDLLDQLDLSCRLVYDKIDMALIDEILSHEIDWNKVHHKIAQLREDSLLYLKNSLSL